MIVTLTDRRIESMPPPPAKKAKTVKANPTSPFPFKSSSYETPKRWKSLKQILSLESKQPVPWDYPTYTSIEAPPSLLPRRKYCDLTGLEAKYTDPKTKLFYRCAEEYQILVELSPALIYSHLEARQAHTILK